MDFQLTEDQEALREGIRSFCDGRFSLDALRALEGTAIDRGLWRELAEMGVFGLRIPESRGGVGLGFADAVLVFAELGRRLVPGPLVWTHLLADRIEGADGGSAIVGGLDLVMRDGAPIVVEHLAQVDALIVLRPDGAYRLDPRETESLAIERPLDPHTPVHHVASLPAGERIGDAAVAAELRLQGAALTAALQFGIAETTQELATAYAKDREQFGRPIGGFQAVKHILADMFVRQELARCAVYAAGATLDDPGVGSVPRAVATAKLVAGDAAMRNARACIQVHGGMGYTWEIPAHYYLKRAWVLENVFGGVEEQSERMAELVAAG